MDDKEIRDQIAELKRQIAENTRRINTLVLADQRVLEAVVAAVNGSIGGRIARDEDDDG